MAKAYTECEYYSAPPQENISEAKNNTSSSDDVIVSSPTSGRPAKLSTNYMAVSDEGARPPSENDGHLKTATKTKQAGNKARCEVGTETLAARTGDATDFFLPGEVLEPASNKEGVSEKLKRDMEESTAESNQSRGTRVEDVLENIEAISRLSGEIIDEVNGKSAKAQYRRSPDGRVNRRERGDLLTSNPSPSPRRSHQPKELITQNKHTTTRFETGMTNAVIPPNEHETQKSSPKNSCQARHTSPRPSCLPEVIDDAEAPNPALSPRYDESSVKTISGDIACNFLQKNDEGKDGVLPATLSLEEYQQRGKPRKKTPKSAVKESLNIEQRFSRMKSAPQCSPPSRRTPGPGKSEEVPNPNLVIEANSRPFSRQLQSPNGIDRKAQSTFRQIPILSKHLEKEEERIKKNIWNNPLSPLPKIGGRQPVIDRTTTAEPIDRGSISTIKESAPSFIEESSSIGHKQPVDSKPCIHGSMLKTPVTIKPGALKTSAISTHEQLESIPGNENDMVSSESAALVMSETVPLGVDVNIRPGGLTYVFIYALEKQKNMIKWVLPSRLQARKDRSREMQSREIRCALELKESLVKTNLEKIELSRSMKHAALEARHETAMQRRQELFSERRLKTIVSIDSKQGKAKHIREVIQENRQDRFRLLHERRNVVRKRKKMLMEIRKEEPMEESVMMVTEENLNLTTDEMKIQGELVNEQNKEKDFGIPDQEAECGGREGGEGSHEGMKDEDESHNAEDGDEADDTMHEIANGNGCDTDNVQRGADRCIQAESAERRVEDYITSENDIENLQTPGKSSHEVSNHQPVDPVRGFEDQEVTSGKGCDTENVSREDDESNQAESGERIVDDRRNHPTQRESSHEVSNHHHREGPVRGTEDQDVANGNRHDRQNTENVSRENDRSNQAESAERIVDDTENHPTQRESSHEVRNYHHHEDPVRGTEEQDVENGNGQNTENVSRGDDRSNQQESAERRVADDSNNSENHTENHQTPRASSRGARNHHAVDAVQDFEDFDEDNVQSALDLEYRLKHEAAYELQVGTRRSHNSTERRDSSVEAVSYYMEVLRAVQDHIEEITARLPDGSTCSAGVLPIVFEEPVPARGDYYDEGDDTTSDTDGESFDDGVEEFVEEEFVEEEIVEEESVEQILLRMNENVGSRRSRANRHVH